MRPPLGPTWANRTIGTADWRLLTSCLHHTDRAAPISVDKPTSEYLSRSRFPDPCVSRNRPSRSRHTRPYFDSGQIFLHATPPPVPPLETRAPRLKTRPLFDKTNTLLPPCVHLDRSRRRPLGAAITNRHNQLRWHHAAGMVEPSLLEIKKRGIPLPIQNPPKTSDDWLPGMHPRCTQSRTTTTCAKRR
jgi:hypothetical protein